MFFMHNSFNDLAKKEEFNFLQEVTQVFFKSTTKYYIDGPEIIYLIISDKGDVIAFFDTIGECQNFARQHDLIYQYSH